VGEHHYAPGTIWYREVADEVNAPAGDHHLELWRGLSINVRDHSSQT
jgi:hypothetical protein